MKISKIALLIISFLNGVSGLVCGALFIIEPGGSLMKSEGIIPMLSNFPLHEIFFTDLFWIGVVMLLILFIPNAAAFSSQVMKRPSAYIAQIIAGVCLIGWCVVEIIWLPNFLVYIYLVVGVIQVALGVSVGRSQPLS